MLTVKQHDTIRRMYYLDHKSARAIAKELGVARQTVAKAITTDTAATYTRTTPAPAPQLGAFKAELDRLLTENERLPRKQRYTGHKMYETICTQGYTGSEASVQGYLVAQRKASRRPKVFIPLAFDPGQDAQVDWGEAQAIIGGVKQTVQVFVMRLNYSRRVFVRAYPSQKQEAFLDAHVHAFTHFGGVPHRLTYDNLSTAVKILTEGRIREENRAFVAFRSYYLFESHFCTPGQGHEKGGVEHGVGFSRRNFMVPMPQVENFAALNADLLAHCVRDDGRTVQGQPQSIGQMGRAEQPHLRPLPARPYGCCVTRTATLTPYSQVVFETNRYSVPVAQARQTLTLKAYPFHLDILDDTTCIATHPRHYGREQDVCDPLHYLPLLEQRPGAFDHAKPIRQWRTNWPPVYSQLLRRLREKWPTGRGVQEFVRVLRLHQQYSTDQIEHAVADALTFNAVHFDGVFHCLQQATQPQQLTLPLLDLSDQPHLAVVGSQPITLAQYDQLLTGGGR